MRCMSNEKIIRFISSKIVDTKVAILHCHSNNVLKVPNTVINTLQVDDTGNIWFYIKRPIQLIHQFEQEFPVALHYFKKGNGYSLNIMGKAHLVTEPDEILICEDLAIPFQQNDLKDHVLVKVKIMKADYQNYRQPTANLLQQLKDGVRSYFNWIKPPIKSFNLVKKQKMMYG